MADYTLSARIVGDSSSLSKSVKDTSSKLEEFQNKIKKTSSNIQNSLGSSIDKTTEKTNSMKESFEKLSSKVKDITSKLSNSFKTIQEKINKINFDKFSKKLDEIGSKVKSVGTKMSVGLTLPITLAGKKMITAASDFEENLNKVDVAFGESAQSVKDWSETALKQFGLAKNQALQATSLFGDMATSMGLTKPAAASMSTSLAGLAGDLASFKNVSIEQAMTALNGVFTGETESLKQLGVVMTETNLEEFANKIGKVYKEMSQAEKVQLRYNYVMEMTKNAQGDYARTSDGTANSIRTFQGALDNLNIVLGQKLLPIFTPIIQKATSMVDKFASASPEFQNMILKIGGIIAVAGPLLVVFGSVAGGISKMITLFAMLNKMQLLAKISTIRNTVATTTWNAVCGIATGVTSALATAFAFLTSHIGLVILAIGSVIAIGYLLIKHWDTVKQFAIDTWSYIQNIFQQFDNWLGSIFVTDWSKQFGILGHILNGLLSSSRDVYNGIKQIFGGVIDFITGVFTGNWSKAWQGVVDIFGGIFNTLSGVLKAPFNAVIGLINAAISGLNKISIKIPDWVPGLGGQKFGVDIPTMPYLKRGTNDFAGGFARINEGGRGELVNLPNGTQVIPHDISTKYAKESARINRNYTTDIDYSKLGEYIVKASNIYAQKIADGLVKGVSNIKVISNNRETARFLLELGFVKG